MHEETQINKNINSNLVAFNQFKTIGTKSKRLDL